MPQVAKTLMLFSRKGKAISSLWKYLKYRERGLRGDRAIWESSDDIVFSDGLKINCVLRGKSQVGKWGYATYWIVLII